MASKNIAIVGASFSGLPLAHYLLKHLPADFTVTLIGPSTHIYWNIGAPRAIVDPALLGPNASDLFIPLLPSFEKYPPGRFTFIQGKAVSSSPATNTITVRTVSDDDTTPVRDVGVEYAHLVIATGARETGGDRGFKSVGKGTHIETRAALAAGRDAIAAATKIVVSGAGATGCELTGEIASKYLGAGKKVMLLSSDPGLLGGVREDVGKTAQSILEKMDVEVRGGVKVRSETKRADGGVDIVLSTGETIQADLHIPTWGMAANTEFLPKELLDAGGWVVTDKYMKTATYANVWALGDVTHWGNKKLTTIDPMYRIVVANLLAAVNGKGEAEFKEYKHNDQLMLVLPLGNRFGRATGFVFGFKVWGWLAWLLKGKTYMIEGNRPIAEGKQDAGRTKI